MEMACNELFGAGEGPGNPPPNPDKYFKLEQAEISAVNTDVESLLIDFQVLIGLIQVVF